MLLGQPRRWRKKAKEQHYYLRGGGGPGQEEAKNAVPGIVPSLFI